MAKGRREISELHRRGLEKLAGGGPKKVMVSGSSFDVTRSDHRINECSSWLVFYVSLPRR